MTHDFERAKPWWREGMTAAEYDLAECDHYLANLERLGWPDSGEYWRTRRADVQRRKEAVDEMHRRYLELRRQRGLDK